MAIKARLHWFWRGAIAFLAGLTALAVCWYLQVVTTVPLLEELRFTMTIAVSQWAGSPTAGLMVPAVILGIPTVTMTLGVRWLLSRYLGDEPIRGESHCRRCNHILRGLSQPRCPECGEAI
jgi:hypothetical protein